MSPLWRDEVGLYLSPRRVVLTRMKRGIRPVHAAERNVVVEFKDRSTAFACYQSPEYQQARTIRQKYADTDFLIIDGVAD